MATPVALQVRDQRGNPALQAHLALGRHQHRRQCLWKPTSSISRRTLTWPSLSSISRPLDYPMASVPCAVRRGTVASNLQRHPMANAVVPSQLGSKRSGWILSNQPPSLSESRAGVCTSTWASFRRFHHPEIRAAKAPCRSRQREGKSTWHTKTRHAGVLL